MLFPKQKIIFIHIPKTGGNYFSRCFVRFSEDQQTILPDTHQVLSDRFGIQGPNTKTKHQSLSDYQEQLGGRLDGYRVFTMIRPPVERLVSLYFSPHRWMRRLETGEFQKRKHNISFSEDKFKRIINRVASTWDFLDGDNLSGAIDAKNPISHTSGAQIYLMPFDDIANQCHQFADNGGFDCADFPKRSVNASASPSLKNKMLKHDRAYLEDLVYATKHAQDRVFFQ